MFCMRDIADDYKPQLREGFASLADVAESDFCPFSKAILYYNIMYYNIL